MISNYLDWVKRQRKFAIQQALMNQRRSMTFVDSWSKGFYRGLGMSSSFEARRWRKLQKDIEARIAHDHRIVVMPAHRDGHDEVLS